MAAILVFMGQIGFGEQTNLGPILLLALFGLILSVVGFFIVIALSLGHQNYIMNVVVILCCWGKSEFYRDWKKPVHYKEWHRLFLKSLLLSLQLSHCSIYFWLGSLLKYSSSVRSMLRHLSLFGWLFLHLLKSYIDGNGKGNSKTARKLSRDYFHVFKQK